MENIIKFKWVNQFIFIIAILFHKSLFANEKEIIKSSISEVTVYAQGAQVYRKATFNVKPGITEVIIDGVCATIDPNSLQVKATGNVIILDSKHSIFYPKPEETALEGLPLKIRKDIQILQDSITNIQFDLQEIQDEIDVLIATKNILASNGAVRGQGKVNDSINLLKQAVDYYSVKMLELNKRIQSLNRKKADKNEKKRGMDDRIYKLRNYQSNANLNATSNEPIHRIIVTLSAKEVVSGKFSISYLVSGAGWTPLYDLRSDIATGKINLNYKAQVYQNTGTDWENVNLNISTNNPYQNKTKPTLHPWYIDYNMYRQELTDYKNNRTMQPAAAKMAEKYSTADSEGLNYQKEAMSSAEFVQVIDHVISAEFRIDLPYTIRSNNEQHMVLVKNVDLAVTYNYFSAPKIDNGAYLIAQLSKLDELQLVPAKANIFFEGSYIGETYLDPTTMEDTLNLSLGKDPNIIIRRNLLKKDCKEKIVNNYIEKTFSYSIDVKNLKSNSINIIIQDQLPITQNTDITIEVINTDKGRYDNKTGIIEWNLNIKTKETKTLEFQYKVKYNKDQNLPL
ncbi:MAG: DUF4139 domain-containing protein [Flavobacteriia bacterium]|nr:DUF4139 domain-containing protein [Flavobacteriia bacterium]